MKTNHIKVDLPKEKIADFCRRHHIRKLAVFGSALREDFRPDSDLDVLVEFDPGAYAWADNWRGWSMSSLRLLGGRKGRHEHAAVPQPLFPRQGVRGGRGASMSRDDLTCGLRHMLDARGKRSAFARGQGRADLDAERHLRAFVGAVCWRSSAKPPAESRLVRCNSLFQHIPWLQIIGMRNRLIHGYDNVDLRYSSGKIVTQDLPPLIAELEKILSSGP